MPYESMEMMAFSFDNRRVLARISKELGTGREDYWNGKAEQVRRRAIEYLWRPEKHAFYDRDKDNRFMDVLLHNNLRVMYFGMATQTIADEFIRHHLLDPAGFWTRMPLPAVAASDPLFRETYRNSWEGPAMDRFIRPRGLTYQRAIRALENYGHYAEVALIGEKLIGIPAEPAVSRVCSTPSPANLPPRPTTTAMVQRFSRFWSTSPACTAFTATRTACTGPGSRVPGTGFSTLSAGGGRNSPCATKLEPSAARLTARRSSAPPPGCGW